MSKELTTSDQILLLRCTAQLMLGKIEILKAKVTDKKLQEYVRNLTAIEDVISDSCVLDLRTEEEIDNLQKEMREERDCRDYTRAIYNEGRI